MKLHPTCFLIALTFLSACAAPTTAVPLAATAVPDVATPTVGAAKTEAPVVVASSTPTEAPTSIPATETATATEAGPKAGDTKVENGYTYTYTDIQANGKEVYKGWFRPMTPTAIPMIDEQGSYMLDGTLAKNIAPITIMVEAGVPGADAIQAFTHTHVSNGQGGTDRYTGFMITEFGNNNNDKWQQARKDFEAGTKKYSVQFGNTSYDWYPSPNHGSIVYVLNYTSPALSAKEDNWTDAPYNNSFKGAFWGLDSQGNTLGAIASQMPLNQLNPDELSIFPFYHVASIMGGSGSDLALYFSGYSQLLQHMMQNSLNSVPPYVEVSTQTPSPAPTP